MSATRGQVMDAIVQRVRSMNFARSINGSATWRNPSTDDMKRLKLWADVPADQQPAAFVVTHSELDEYRGLGLVRRRLNLAAWCYSRSDNAPGQPDLDTMVQAFEDKFGPKAADNFSTNQLTLNELVYWCRIEGKVFKDPGDIDNQTLLIVPIVVEMP